MGNIKFQLSSTTWYQDIVHSMSSHGLMAALGLNQ